MPKPLTVDPKPWPYADIPCSHCGSREVRLCWELQSSRTVGDVTTRHWHARADCGACRAFVKYVKHEELGPGFGLLGPPPYTGEARRIA